MFARLAFVTCCLAATTVSAQVPDFTGVDFNAVLANSPLTQNLNNFRANMVRQAQQDPRIVNAYQQYMAGGGYPVTFAAFAEEYYASRGFTDRAGSERVKREIQERERVAVQGLRQAEENRRRAQTECMEGFQRNNREFGNLLNGNSTYNQNGQPVVLPHTWQPNTYNQYNGHVYYVDFGGRYYVVR